MRRCKDRIPGGLASGKCPSDFDQKELARGTRVELEHTASRLIAREIAQDHLVEDKSYYRKLARMEGYQPNRRVKTIDAKDLAIDMRRRFADRDVTEQIELDCAWPSVVQHVGESLAVAYSSDKWKPRGDMVAYKHIAESPNVALMRPGLIPGAIGPMVDIGDVPMPTHFAMLGLFEEADFRLHVGGTNESPELGADPDEGCVQIMVKHGFLGGSYIRWSAVGGNDRPFLFIYTEADGVLGIILGAELDVQKDGIVG